MRARCRARSHRPLQATRRGEECACGRAIRLGGGAACLRGTSQPVVGTMLMYSFMLIGVIMMVNMLVCLPTCTLPARGQHACSYTPAPPPPMVVPRRPPSASPIFRLALYSADRDDGQNVRPLLQLRHAVPLHPSACRVRLAAGRLKPGEVALGATAAGAYSLTCCPIWYRPTPRRRRSTCSPSRTILVSSCSDGGTARSRVTPRASRIIASARALPAAVGCGWATRVS